MVVGDSAWNKRHKQGHFKGEIIPFGALVDFRPPKPILNRFLKFEKRSMPGILLGYYLMSGERWYGDFLVAPLHDFQSPPPGGVRVCRISEVIIDKVSPFRFPLRESKDRDERSLDVIESADINYTHMYDNKQGTNNEMDEALLLNALDATINQDPTLEELDDEINKESIKDDDPITQPKGSIHASSSSSSSSRGYPYNPLATESNRVEEVT